MPDVTLRAAGPEDVQAIPALHTGSWRTTYRGAYPDEFLDGNLLGERTGVWTDRLCAPPPNQLVVVAEDGAEVVGFACAYGSHDEHWGSFLDNIHTRGDRHGRGIGTRLVFAVVAWAHDRYPDHGLHLRVLEQNERARQFYEGLGATDRGRVVVEPPGVGAIAVRLYAWDSLHDARKTEPEPRGLIAKYAAAVERGENPEPLMFFRPDDDGSIEDFVDRVWQQIEGRPLMDKEREDVRAEIAEHERTPKRRRPS